MGEFLDAIDHSTLSAVRSRVDGLKTAGVWTGPIQLGSILAEFSAKQFTIPPTAIATALATPGATPAVTPAPLPNSPEARMAALEVLIQRLLPAAGLATPAPTFTPTPHTAFTPLTPAGLAPAAATPVTVTGHARVLLILRPTSALAATEVEMWRSVGGSQIIRRMARAPPDNIEMEINDVLVDIDGLAAEAVARSATSNVMRIINHLTLHKPLFVLPSTAPDSWGMAAGNIHTLIREVESTRGSQISPAAGTASYSETLLHKPPPSSAKELKVVSLNASSTTLSRACSVPVLAPLANNESVWASRATTPILGDPYAEGARLVAAGGGIITEKGAATGALIHSSMVTLDALSGDIPVAHYNCGMSIHSHLVSHLERFNAGYLVTETANINSLAQGIRCSDIELSLTTRLLVRHPNKITHITPLPPLTLPPARPLWVEQQGWNPKHQPSHSPPILSPLKLLTQITHQSHNQ